MLYVEILEVAVELGVVEVKRWDAVGDDGGEEGLLAVETALDVVVVGAAKGGVASTSP